MLSDVTVDMTMKCRKSSFRPDFSFSSFPSRSPLVFLSNWTAEDTFDIVAIHGDRMIETWKKKNMKKDCHSASQLFHVESVTFLASWHSGLIHNVEKRRSGHMSLWFITKVLNKWRGLIIGWVRACFNSAVPGVTGSGGSVCLAAKVSSHSTGDMFGCMLRPTHVIHWQQTTFAFSRNSFQWCTVGRK